MNYSDRLIELRDEQDLKQKEVAKKLGISNVLYNIYEKQNKIIPSKYINALCLILDISIDYFLGLTENKKYKNSKKEINLELLHQRLIEFRKSNQLTQAKLAKKLKVSQSVVSDFEKTGKLIPLVYLYSICKQYNISADYLLGKTDEKTIN